MPEGEGEGEGVGEGVGLGEGVTVTGGGSCVGEPPHDDITRQLVRVMASLALSIGRHL